VCNINTNILVDSKFKNILQPQSENENG